VRNDLRLNLDFPKFRSHESGGCPPIGIMRSNTAVQYTSKSMPSDLTQAIRIF